ncbi:class I SAM-dependent methyltransferase [Cellulomonas fimi]|uniref:Methyltransferase type 11 n=1 Tax=Cellulomonas fimi (strain ATCC 484 / DSM 20113 / JCM 1341 / CCUG 24087 / LMG 16345 / NBRC 15513 / NCIMB 8980 / NCTC 7547 / NRS-133) TaxID=590998 RepID=F4H5W2_CELFA|nr:methyltransferase domain-containing protein [Cellulomonas fimi]AEE45562.1 Methyltransferase type 11 [Cellulomonas fimi ATCC 484]NNH05927.1 methyltransferase domain-containing protein [Cellulomonas fimi]VEH29869.1 Rebeccamycin O-methyltransferase [Cellulomonas fimi]
MGFDVDPDAYDRFMGRFSAPLADEVVATLGVGPTDAVLDVGCGPGALTSRLVGRAGRVAAVDPAEPFVAAVRTRLPDVDVRRAGAQDLPFDDGTFDVSVAQLVVHFLPDPVAGLREMRRVTRTGGTVAVCVWDHAARGPLAAFWRAVRDLDPASPGEDLLPGVRRGHLARLCRDAGLAVDDDGEATVSLRFDAFADWWEPFTLGVGPAGDHVAGLDAAGQARLRDRCAQVLGPPPFTVDATAWVVRAHV